MKMKHNKVYESSWHHITHVIILHVDGILFQHTIMISSNLTWLGQSFFSKIGAPDLKQKSSFLQQPQISCWIEFAELSHCTIYSCFPSQLIHLKKHLIWMSCLITSTNLFDTSKPLSIGVKCLDNVPVVSLRQKMAGLLACWCADPPGAIRSSGGRWWSCSTSKCKLAEGWVHR